MIFNTRTGSKDEKQCNVHYLAISMYINRHTDVQFYVRSYTQTQRATTQIAFFTYMSKSQKPFLRKLRQVLLLNLLDGFSNL